MRFYTFSNDRYNEQLGIEINQLVYPINEIDETLPVTMEEFLEEAALNLNKIKGKLDNVQKKLGFSLDQITIHAPLKHPNSIRDFMAFEEHLLNASKTSGINVAEQWYEIPAFYFTNHHTIHGPNESIKRPPNCNWLDYELEIAVVIGKEGINISKEEADQYIFGYTILNDWSARDLQMKEMAIGLGPAKGKDFATSIGPCIVTAEALESYKDKKGFNLAMKAYVNDKLLSEGNFNSIYYSFGEMIERASAGVTLYPGDIIGSGTVGTGCILEQSEENREWLKSGDKVTLSIEHIGELTNYIAQ